LKLPFILAGPSKYARCAFARRAERLSILMARHQKSLHEKLPAARTFAELVDSGTIDLCAAHEPVLR
jgi:hypothetical protein